MSIPEADFQDIKRQAADLYSQQAQLKALFTEYEDIFFMENKDRQPSDTDPDDWKPTISPTGRNSVVGMTRLLKTAEPKFTVEGGQGSDKIEEGLLTIITESNKALEAKVQDDAILSAVLYGPVTLMIDSVDAILKVKSLPEYERTRLQEIRKATPFIYSVIPQAESYPKFGRYGGLRAHLWRYETTVDDVRERWGESAVGGKGSEKVIVNDWYGPKYRAVWIEGKGGLIEGGEHKLPFIPIVCKTSGGSNLFNKPERKVQSFLYATVKAKLHQRETLVYSSLFTSMFLRGPGPLVSIDPQGLAQTGDKIVVNYAGGGLRYIIGQATPINDKGIDRDMYDAKRLLDELNGQSTIHGQSLGEGVGANVPFSSLVTMAQTGRLPLVDPAEAVGAVFADAGAIVLKWIKTDGIDNEIIPAAEIDDDITIKCEMSPDLPQDQLRNSTIAAQLKGLVSKEWIHSNLLNITDSGKMTKAIWSEESADALYQEIVKQTLPQLLQMLAPNPPAPPMGAGPTGQTPPMPQGMPPQGIDPNMPPMPTGAGPQMPGGAPVPTIPGMPGAESLPMVDSRMPQGQ